MVTNNCGINGAGLALLLQERRIDRVIASYIGTNQEFARQYLAGEIEVELIPQGTLAERLRAGGAGIAAFYTPTGVGTMVADGGLPRRYGPAGEVVTASPRKEVRNFSVGGAMEVSAGGDLATWMVPGLMVKGIGVQYLIDHTAAHVDFATGPWRYPDPSMEVT